MLGIDELIPSRRAHVLNIIDQEEIAGCVVGEENDLCTSFGKVTGHRCTNTRRATLEISVSLLKGASIKLTVIITTLECMTRSDLLLAPPNQSFARNSARSHGKTFKIG